MSMSNQKVVFQNKISQNSQVFHKRNVKTQATPVKKDLKQAQDIKDASKLAVFGLALSVSSSAQAQVEGVDVGVNKLVGAVEAGGDLVKTGIGYLDYGADELRSGLEFLAPYVKEAVDVASPYVYKGAAITSEVLNDIVIPNVQKALPVIQSNVSQFAQDQGLNTNQLQEQISSLELKLDQATTNAQPLLSKFLTFVSTSQPLTLAEYAAALVAFYYVSPTLFKALFQSVRGFAGVVPPAAVLNKVQEDGNSYLVDIRTLTEKERSGIPDLPSGYQYKLIENDYASIDNQKVRRQLKNPDNIECEVTAMQIASLKRLNKGTTVFLMDRYGNKAKDVAKSLARRGFGKVFVVQGGFEGGNGWANSKLAVNKRQVYNAEILPQVFGTSSRKALPGS